MSKDKIWFHLYSGDCESNSRNLVYKFGNTSGIKMVVSPLGYSVTVARCTRKTPDEILNDNLFRDALRKVSRLQLVLYGKLSNSPVYISIDGIEYCLNDNVNAPNGSLIYSLCGTSLVRRIDSEWNDDALRGILDTTKSKDRRIDASLDSLIIAKSKSFESERFVYLWMAMNGLYGYASEYGKKYARSKNEQNWLKRECGQLKFFCMLNNLPYRGKYDDKTEPRLLRKLENLLANIKETQIEEITEALKNNNSNNCVVSEINKLFVESGIEDGKMHPYAAVLVFTSYKIRCKYFHAEKAMPLFCLENEHPVPVLRFLNYVLEDYLDNSITRWFNNNYFKTVVEPQIEKIATNCLVNRGQLKSCVIDGDNLY